MNVIFDKQVVEYEKIFLLIAKCITFINIEIYV